MLCDHVLLRIVPVMANMGKTSALNVNIPTVLRTTLEGFAAAAGADLTSVVLRALHEFVAEPGINNVTALAGAGALGVDEAGNIMCDRCGAKTLEFLALLGDPLTLVCAPYCSDGPCDADGNQIEVGDVVTLYLGPSGSVNGTIVSLSVDGNWNSLADVQVPGANRLYRQSARKVVKTND